MYDSDKRKLLSVLSHGAIFFSATVLSVGLPIAILFLSEDPVVKGNARESLNFHLNLYLYGILFGLLTFVLIGFPLLLILFAASWILPIIAIVKVLSNPTLIYRYPFLFRLV
ncbi:DUF4870 domain-containing protein [Laspinema olomoucense]|uniref:DUF4870 domain-containing protein n=1 Tax=Laspinema olomoucense TaxID=3231600 RepID=UPI0021BB3FC8|nr:MULTISPECIES: DUF4870 domain-containing protein [unclassified Laspinema]MCT7972417.1 DUF4870 domain-containing protein [Laspinema sp. D3d]MCT7986959.1 DUF4870 domain-containing protein [Laspinema sp. D3a]MCT7994334.1 DUF4870 domain-containing protein [Laspinema sp. D3c]